MLVLSRKYHETIVINNGQIVVSVVEIRGDKVRLGVTAPREISVHRGEIQDKIEPPPLCMYGVTCTDKAGNSYAALVASTHSDGAYEDAARACGLAPDNRGYIASVDRLGPMFEAETDTAALHWKTACDNNDIDVLEGI